MFELADHWKKRAIEMLRRALVSDGCVRLFRDTPQKSFAEMRFANSRVAAHKGHLAFTPLGLIPECQQLLQFLVAGDRPGDLAQTPCREAAFDRSLPGDTACAGRRRKSDEFVSLGIAANESTAEEPARTRSDEDRIGSRQIAQPCRNSLGFPDGLVLTGERQARRYGHLRLQRLAP